MAFSIELEGSSEGVLMILGMFLIPFLLLRDSVGAKFDFFRMDLKSNGPLSSSLFYQRKARLVSVSVLLIMI